MNETPPDDDLLAALARHALGSDRPFEVARVNMTPIAGGFVAKSVERLDLTLTMVGERPRIVSYVRKGCAAREVAVLQVLGAAGLDAAPELVIGWTSADHPDDQDANGFVSPFYPGGPLRFGDPIPTAVVATLARLHAAHGAASVHGVWTFDAEHVDRLRAGALRALELSERFQSLAPDHLAWRERLDRAASAPALREAAETLPRTLTHGDMHPGNILRRAGGSPVIIDWGNTCLAPAMLDLANIIQLGSPEWNAYVEALRATGAAFDPVVARRAFWWARAATALMYLPWAVDNSDRAPALIVQMEDAVAQLA